MERLPNTCRKLKFGNARSARRKLTINTAQAPDNQIRLIAADEHQIKETDINPAAMSVVKGLTAAGYEAFLVGGCVRDLLLGLKPKDFDVATSATPEQIRKQFKRARIIGRRFRLVHVRFGREVIEVSTYRAGQDSVQDNVDEHEVSASGRLLSDNVFGNRGQDVARRDFTVNALFYDCQRHEVLDYLAGFDDLKAKKLKVIGDAQRRYREDPVRMLRAIRFAAILGFQMDAQTEQPIRDLAPMIAETPPARLFDEVLKLFHQGHAETSFDLMRSFGLFAHLFPQTHPLFPHANGLYEKLMRFALANTDARIAEDKPVIAAFLFAVTLWGPFIQEFERIGGNDRTRQDAIHQAANEVISRQALRISIPRRVSAPAIEIWDMQWRLQDLRPRQVARTFDNRRFRAGYDFLMLRAHAGENVTGLADWWTRFQEVSEEERANMLNAPKPNDDHKLPQKRRASRRKNAAK